MKGTISAEEPARKRKPYAPSVMFVVACGVLTGLVLASCSTHAKTKSDFQAVDKVVDGLQLRTLGRVELDEKTGGHQTLAGQPATRTLAIYLPVAATSDAQATVDKRLDGLGYATDQQAGVPCSTTSPCRYRNPSRDVGVGLIVYPAGTDIDPDGQTQSRPRLTVPQGSTGVLLTVSAN